MQPAGPLTVPINTRENAVRNLAGGLLALFFGLSGLIAPFTDSVRGGTTADVISFVLGLIFTAMGLRIVIGMYVARGKRDLVFEAQGMRLVAEHGRTWAIAWSELATVSLHIGYHRGRGGKTYRVRLVFEPSDATAFQLNHRGLGALRGKFGATPSGYGVAFGPRIDLVAAMDTGLQTHAGSCYRGAFDDGQIAGLSYL